MALDLPPMRMPHVGRPRLPMKLPPGIAAPGLQVGAGALAIVAASLAAVPFVRDFDVIDNVTRIGVVISLVAAVVGGVLTVVRIAVGPPLAAGGVAWFAAGGIALALSRIDVSGAWSSTDAKLVLASGAASIVAAVLCATLFVGRSASVLGGLIVILAVVMVACTAALIHIDDRQDAIQIGVLAGSAFVAIVISIGALRGRWGSVAAIVAAGAQVPGWIDFVRADIDRGAAAVGGLVAVIGIVVLAAVVVVLAATGASDTYGKGPEHAVVSPVVQPMVRPQPIPAGGFEPRVGPVLMPVNVVNRVDGDPTAPGRTVLGAVPIIAPTTSAAAQFAAAGSAPAQWAADPFNRFELRYYDGLQWTEHVSTEGVAGVDRPEHR